MGADQPFRAVLVGQRERQGGLHVTTCESAIAMKQWRCLRFSYGDHGQVVAYDAADTKVVSLTADGFIYVHSVFDLEPMQVIQSDIGLGCVCLSQDSHRYIGCGSSQGEIHIWNAFNSQRFSSYKAHSDPVQHVAINNDDSYVASCSEHNLVFYSLILSKIVLEVSHSVITNLVFSPLRKYLVCATDDNGSVAIYDVKSKGVVVRFESAHDAPVTGAAFSPTNKVFFVTCGLDRCVSFFDIGAKLKIATRIQTEAPLTSVQFAPNGARIVLTDSSFQTIVYDLRSTSQPLLKFAGGFSRLLKYVTLPIHQIENRAGSSKEPTTPGSTAVPSSFFSPIGSKSTVLSESSEISAPVVTAMSSMFSPLRSAPELACKRDKLEHHHLENLASPLFPSRNSRDPIVSVYTESEGDDCPKDQEIMALQFKGSKLFSPVQSKLYRDTSLSQFDQSKNNTKTASLIRTDSLSAPIQKNNPSHSNCKLENSNEATPLNASPIKGDSVYESEQNSVDNSLSTTLSNEDFPIESSLLDQIGNSDSRPTREDFQSEKCVYSQGTDSLSSPPVLLKSQNMSSSNASSQLKPENDCGQSAFPLQKMNQIGAIQAEIIRSAVDESVVVIRNDIRNLHLDMIRFFHSQKIELAAQFNAELDHLKRDLAQAVDENHQLRQQIDRFGSFPISN